MLSTAPNSGAAQKLARLSVLEQSFRYRNSAPDREAWFTIMRGDVPVLISAPHACMHSREGVGKMEEEFTGALAFHLAEVCNCYAIVTRYKTSEDPNWQTNSLYKKAIKKLHAETELCFLIDLHGMTNKYHMGVAIGTINGKSCSAASVLPHFINAGFQLTAADCLTPNADTAWRRVVVDHSKFTGGVVNHTVNRFASAELGMSSVQIEISSQARVVKSAATDDWPCEYRGNPEAIIATVTALENLVASVA